MTAVIAVPALVVAATLLARRFGHAIAGLVAGLPLTSGPLSVALALDHGERFAADAATGSLVGITATTAVYALYALVAPHIPWQAAVLGAAAAFALLALALTRLPWTLPAAALAALVAAAAVGALLHRRLRPSAPLGSLDLLPRALAALVVVVAITALARVAGPVLVGALTPLPVVVGILVVFAERRVGTGAALLVLDGAARGTYAFAAFFAVVGAAVERLPLAATYVLATAAACLAASVAQLVRRPPPRGTNPATIAP